MKTRTLCRPADDLSCFRCCPPIRPAEYDHLDHRSKIDRLLERNTLRIQKRGPGGSEIDGRSCWGLGYLNQSRTCVGCLLHPRLNQGQDLRQATGYRDKCDREICPQAKYFNELVDVIKAEIVELIVQSGAGVDSFAFSSPMANPAWTLLLWGDRVLEMSRSIWNDPANPGRAYLLTHPNPRGCAYPLALYLSRIDPDRFEPDRLEKALCQSAGQIKLTLHSPLASEPWVHRLGLDRDLADFIRLYLGTAKADRGKAMAVEQQIRAIIMGID